MASATEPMNPTSFQSNSLSYDTHVEKSIPILPSIAAPVTEAGDPMDTSHNRAGSMDPLAMNGADGEEVNELTPTAGHDQQQSINGGGSLPVGAAAAAQQPKVVQTAFIHKLYK